MPADLVAEMTRVAAAGHTAWVQAHADSDFAAFRRIWSASSSCAGVQRLLPEARPPYDPLLDDFEPGMTDRRRARHLRAACATASSRSSPRAAGRPVAAALGAFPGRASGS